MLSSRRGRDWMPSLFASPFDLGMQALESMWPAPPTLDMFPPSISPFAEFDRIDRMLNNQLSFIDTSPRPMITTNLTPVMCGHGGQVMPQKYRISLDLPGYAPDSIRTEMTRTLKPQGRDQINLIVSSRPGVKKDFRRSFTLPKNVQTTRMVRFMAPNGLFVVEFPLVETPTRLDIDLVPRIVRGGGREIVSLNVTIPKAIDPTKVQVSVKKRDLILRFEEKTLSRKDTVSRVYYYNQVTLPDNTDVKQIKCELVKNNKLRITAPIRTGPLVNQGNIPIKRKSSPKGRKSVSPVTKKRGGSQTRGQTPSGGKKMSPQRRRHEESESEEEQRQVRKKSPKRSGADILEKHFGSGSKQAGLKPKQQQQLGSKMGLEEQEGSGKMAGLKKQVGEKIGGQAEQPKKQHVASMSAQQVSGTEETTEKKKKPKKPKKKKTGVSPDTTQQQGSGEGGIQSENIRRGASSSPVQGSSGILGSSGKKKSEKSPGIESEQLPKSSSRPILSQYTSQE